LIKKLAFCCLSNLKEKWLKKLTRRLITRTMTTNDHFAEGGGRPDLKFCMSSQNSWKGWPWFEMKLWFILNLRNQQPTTRNHTLMNTNMKRRLNTSSIRCSSQFAFRAQ
jgi:hypothetical protein